MLFQTPETGVLVRNYNSEKTIRVQMKKGLLIIVALIAFPTSSLSQTTSGENIIKNGDFSLESDWFFIDGLFEGSIGGIENGEYAISNITGNGDIYVLQVEQPFNQQQTDSIYTGPYQVSFDARTSTGEKDINVFFGQLGGNWVNYFDQEKRRVTIDTVMSNYILKTFIEETWTEMRLAFEVNSSGEDFFLDNVELTRLPFIRPDNPLFDLTVETGLVTISITDQGADSYDIYFSDSTFTSPEEGQHIGTIDSLFLAHSVVVPNSTLSTSITGYYGVIAKSESGVPSEMTISSVEIQTGVREAMIAELTQNEMDQILDAMSENEIPDASSIKNYFSDVYKPFEVNESNNTAIFGDGISNDSDLSGKFWIGHESVTESKYLILYAEIVDDILNFTPNDSDGNYGWNFDSWDIGIGAYEPASNVTGTNHQDFQTGTEPDYQFRAGLFNDNSGFIVGFNPEISDANFVYSQTVGEVTENGYRLLTVLNTARLSIPFTNNAGFSFPTGSNITTVPFNIVLNDNDGMDRETAAAWSDRSTGQWFNTPSEWGVATLLGKVALNPFPKPSYSVGDTMNFGGNFAEFDLGTNLGGGDGWFFDNVNGPSTYDIVNDSQDGDGKAVQANINHDGGEDIWRAQIVNEPFYVGSQDLIKVSFWMKADQVGRIAEAFIGLPEEGNYAEVATQRFDLSTVWTKYELEYFTNENDSSLGMRFGVKLNAAENNGAAILLDNVQIIKQEAVLTDLKFSVNLGVQKDLGNFSSDSITVGAVGSFNGWDTGNPLILTADNDSVYSGTTFLVNISLGDTVRYKFIMKEDDTGSFEWESPDPESASNIGDFSDRFILVNDLATTSSPVHYFNDFERADQDPDNYGITSIQDARNLPMNTHVATQGIVTSITYNFVYIQEGDAATLIFRRPFFSDQNSLSFDQAIANGEINVGDDLKVSGITGEFNGQHQVLRIHGWEVVSSSNPLPALQTISINEYSNNGEEYESELVRVPFIRLDEPADTLRGGFLYEVTNLDSSETGWLAMQGGFNNEWANQVAPDGYFTFKGVIKEFFVSSLGGPVYAITPHELADIELEDISDATLAISSFPGLLGETFDYAIGLNDVGSETIEALEFTISFDPEAVNITLGDQTGTLIDDFTSLESNLVSPGQLLISAAGTTPITTSGVLMNLEIELLSGGITDVILENILINEAALAPVYGEVNVVLRRCGDVSGDKTISALDATLVLQNSVKIAEVFPLIELDSLAADVTSNGDISALDAARILQYNAGMIEKLDCISLPVKKAPQVVKADWSLSESIDEINFVKLDFRNSEFDVFALQMEMEITEGTTFKRIFDLQDDWNMMVNVREGKTYLSMYGVTPLENKNIELEFENLTSASSPKIEASLTLNESSFDGLTNLSLKELPTEFKLTQNYPNPFNPTTNINYSLPQEVDVQLVVFNSLGQRVATLVNQKQEAGVYTISWDASAASSGVYIYQLKAGSTVFTKKMLLIK